MPHIPGHQSSYSYGFNDPFEEFVDTTKNKNIDSIPDAFASIGAFANLPAEQVANAMSGVFNTFSGGQKGLIEKTNQESFLQNIMANVAQKEYDDNLKELADVGIYPEGSTDFTSGLAKLKPGDLFPGIIPTEFINDDIMRTRFIQNRKDEQQAYEMFGDISKPRRFDVSLTGDSFYGQKEFGGLPLDTQRKYRGAITQGTAPFTTFQPEPVFDLQAFNEAQAIKNDIAAAPGYTGFIPPALTAAIQQQESFIEPTPTYGQLARTYEDFIDPSRGAFGTNLGISSPSDMGYFDPSTRRIPESGNVYKDSEGNIVFDQGGLVPTTSILKEQELIDLFQQRDRFGDLIPIGEPGSRMSLSELQKIARAKPGTLGTVQPGLETAFIDPETIGTYGESAGVPSGIQETTKAEKTTAEKIADAIATGDADTTGDAGTTEGPIPGVSSAFGTEEYPLTYIAPDGTVYNWKSDGKGGAIFEFKEGELAFKASQVSSELRDSTSTGKEVTGTITSVKPGGPPVTSAAATATPGVTSTAGVPTIPAGNITPSATNLFANQYEEGLEPFEQYLRYRQSAFPDSTLGQRIAAQSSLGAGYQPTMGRFLLGTAAERFLPQEGLTPGAEFASYLRGQPRADLSQIRQEYANLAQALGSYGAAQDVSQLNQPIAKYTGIFGTPGSDFLKSNILSATQAALGGSAFLDDRSLGRVYDAMEQQYGADVGARFADFVGRGFGVQGNLPTFMNTPVSNPISSPENTFGQLPYSPNPAIAF